MIKDITLFKGMKAYEINKMLTGKIELVDDVFEGMDFKHTWKCMSCRDNTFTRRWRGVREGRLVCERCRSFKLSGDDFYNIKLLKGMLKSDVNSMISKWISLEDDIYLGADAIHTWRYPSGKIRCSRWADIKNKSVMTADIEGNECLNTRTSLSREELIDKFHKYYNEKGKVPTLKNIKDCEYFPSKSYIESFFGNYKNALIQAKLFDLVDNSRFSMDISKDDIILNTKKLINDFLQRESVVSVNDIDKCSYLPKHTTVYKAFGLTNGIDGLYEFFGHDINDLKSKFLRKKLSSDLIELEQRLGRTPSSRDIDRHLKSKEIHGSSLYIKEFGSLYDAYKSSGLKPTTQSISIKITNEELISLLIDLSNKLGRTPTCLELEEYGLPSRSLFLKRFGGYEKALDLAGLKKNKRKFMSNKGKVFNSTAEVKFANMLEYNNVLYNSETYYKDVILNFKRMFRFDFDIEYCNHRIFIEIFGIQNNEFYENRKLEKIKVCQDNNIKLVHFNWQEIMSLSEFELYMSFLDKLNAFNCNK